MKNWAVTSGGNKVATFGQAFWFGIFSCRFDAIWGGAFPVAFSDIMLAWNRKHACTDPPDLLSS